MLCGGAGGGGLRQKKRVVHLTARLPLVAWLVPTEHLPNSIEVNYLTVAKDCHKKSFVDTLVMSRK